MYRGKCSGKQKYKKKQKQSATIFERVVALFLHSFYTNCHVDFTEGKYNKKKARKLRPQWMRERNVNEKDRRKIFDESRVVLVKVQRPGFR